MSAGPWRARLSPFAGRQWTADCVAIRVTPAVDYRHPRLPPEIWLLAEREVGPRSKTRFYYVNLPAAASLAEIARLAHQRWPIEQQYQELKTELGLDHFEGRTHPGWHHHVVLTALTYNFLQAERRRTRVDLTFPMVRERVERGDLCLHGWYYVIEEGQVLGLDMGSGEFRPLS